MEGNPAIEELERRVETLEHRNRILSAIRSVSQLIVREKDRGRLIQGTCDNLIETRGYYNAWVALFDETGTLVHSAEAGLGEEFQRMVAKLERGETPSCWKQALYQSEAVIIYDPVASCGECPLAYNYVDKTAMASRLEHEEKVFGLLTVSIPREFAESLEETRLLQEVAKDIGFALHNLEMEEERNRVEQELQAAKKQAEKASKAKSDFLAKMSHEMRTPMNSLLGTLRLTLSSDLPGKQRARLQVAKDSAESLLWLVNDLLDLSKIGDGQFSLHEKEFRPRRLLKNVLKEMELLASEKGIDVALSVDPELPAYLVGDPYRVKRILINLLSNAIKFTDHGSIRVAARQLELSGNGSEGEVFIDRVLFTVEDSGAGMSSEKLEALLAISDQENSHGLSAERGEGLGLSICQKLVQQMNGRMWAESELGQGSTFYVEIPFKTDGVLSNEWDTLSDAEQKEHPPSLRILLVEDERMNQIFTHDLLSSNGHRVEIVEDGRQALDILTRKSFDLVLMDIRLPVMDGIEATRRIRTADPRLANPEIPIIGLSAHAATEDELNRFQEAGFNDYLVKPVDFETLFGSFREVLLR